MSLKAQELEQLLMEALGEIEGACDPGEHRRAECPQVGEEGEDGGCDTCDLGDHVQEIVDRARDRLARLRLGVAA